MAWKPVNHIYGDNIKIIVNDKVPKDELWLGYPDGRGGMKPGAVKIVNIGSK